MSENGTYRLDRMETDIKETKAEVKQITAEQIEQGKQLISMGSDMKQTVETNKAIKNTAISFLVINVLGLLWVFFQSIY